MMAVVTLLITYLVCFVTWAFIVMYHLISHGAWRRDSMGWHVMAITGVDAAIFTMLTLVTFWPVLATYSWYQWVYLAMVSGIAVVTVWRAVILWRLYRPRTPVE